MHVIVAHIRWVMVISGVLTSTMVHAALAPDAAMMSSFGETLTGPAATLVVRSWGALIALVGLMLIYGAFVPQTRTLVLIVGAASKAFFVGLVLSHGTRYLGYQAGIAVIIDSVIVLLFGWYLLAAGTPKGDSHD